MQTDLGGFLDREDPAVEVPPGSATRAVPAPPADPPRPPADRTILDLLGDDEPAPRGEGGKPRIMSIEALLDLACPAGLAQCLDGSDFSAAQIRQTVPALAVAYTNANVLGTALGDGVNGIGLHLWRGPRGLFRGCRENAVLAAKRLTADELDAAARKCGLATAYELAQRIRRLPSGKPACQS